MADPVSRDPTHNEQCPWNKADLAHTRSVCGCPPGWPKPSLDTTLGGLLADLIATWREKGNRELSEAATTGKTHAAVVAAMRLHCADELEATLAALATSSPPVPQGWRPIDTAPQDGTLFLAYAPSYAGLPAMQSLCAWHSDAGFCIDELRTASYWMPLPMPPGVSPAVPDHAGLVKERELLLKAVNDEKLSDGTVRCIVRDVLSPEPVTADDIEWAKAALWPTGGETDFMTKAKQLTALFEGDTHERKPIVELRFGKHLGKSATFITIGAQYERPRYIGAGGVIGMLTAMRDILGGKDIDEVGHTNNSGCETCDYGSFYATEFVVWPTRQARR